MTTGILLLIAVFALPIVIKGVVEILERIGTPVKPIERGRVRNKTV